MRYILFSVGFPMAEHCYNGNRGRKSCVYAVPENDSVQSGKRFDGVGGLWFGNSYFPLNAVSRVVKNSREFLAVSLVVH